MLRGRRALSPEMALRLARLPGADALSQRIGPLPIAALRQHPGQRGLGDRATRRRRADLVEHARSPAQTITDFLQRHAGQKRAISGVIDRIVPEPVGGAQRDPAAAVVSLAQAIGEELDALSGLDADTLRRQREERFLAIGRDLSR